jgi:protein-tyrosine phosphatase
MQSVLTSAVSRHLPLSGTYNVRDIGGYRTRDGHVTRWRTMFRADSLHRLSPEAQTALLAHGVHMVIDLRRSDELRAAPNVFASSTTVTYRHLSLLTDTPDVPGVPQPLVEIYRQMLDARQAQICELLQALAAPGGVPAVVHCSAGKDRTGVIIALALGLVGVDVDTISADYALSATYLVGSFLKATRQRALARGYTWEQYQPLVQCPATFMHATLQYIEMRYGGIEAYIRRIGLSHAEIAALRTALVDES